MSNALQPGDPTQIGPYRILQKLGAGGMGEVYEAEQTEPVRRRVALKVLKLGLDTSEVIARFEAERQALALMDHPCIAKVFDGGATETGRPYFIMELVKGTPLADFCDTHKLSTPDRLRLFIRVCMAVQHAHQKGVIHRDLKPSNVLVSLQDGQPVPKVIDFGIAKATGHDLTDRTLVTQFGHFMGTPKYVSPEQAEMSPLGVDTRTDIYSMGVILYELLVGAPPLDLVGVAWAAMSATIREEEPPAPSSKLMTLSDDSRENVARSRQTDPGALRRELRDLDAVIMKCLEKDRTRRYDTAHGLAMDLERHLRQEPVLAQAPSAAYRMRKFVRRHRVAVAFAGMLFLLLTALAVSLSVQFVRVAREQDRTAREVAKAEAVFNEFTGEFFTRLNSTLGATASDPEAQFEVFLDQSRSSLAPASTISEIANSAAQTARSQFVGDREVDGAIRHAMGQVYLWLTLGDLAKPVLEEALRIRLEVLGEEHIDVVRTLELLSTRGLNTPDSTVLLLDRTLSIMRRLGRPDDDPRVQGNILRQATMLVRDLGRVDEADAMITDAMERTRARNPDHPFLLEAPRLISSSYQTVGQFELAERFLRIAIANERLDDPAHNAAELDGRYYYDSIDRDQLLFLLLQQGKYEEALDSFLQLLAHEETSSDPDPDRVVEILGHIGRLSAETGDPGAAELSYRRAQELDTGRDFRREIGEALCEQGRADEGTALLASAVDDTDVWTLKDMSIAVCLGASGQYEEAEKMLLEHLEDGVPSEDMFQMPVHRRLADLYDAWGRPERAAAHRRN